MSTMSSEESGEHVGSAISATDLTTHRAASMGLADLVALVEARIEELDTRNTPAYRFVVQAVELAELPAGKPRRTYVTRFYEIGELDSTAAANVRTIGALGSGKRRLGWWFTAVAHRRVWMNAAHKAAWHYPYTYFGPDPLRHPYLAAIALASEVVQEIRFLNDAVIEAFDTKAIAPVDVDEQLVDITDQLLAAADVREKIGNRPEETTPDALEFWSQQNRELDSAVWTPVLNRIGALITYRDALQAARKRSARDRSNAKIDNLVVGAGSNELGAGLVTEATRALRK